MTCQHILFESDVNPAAMPPEALLAEPGLETWFQPIVDTFEHRILAHECLLRLSGVQTACDGESVEAARVRSLAIHTAARQARQGLYFFNLLPSSIDDPALDLSSALEALFDCGMRPGNVVFEVAESDLARDPAHSQRIRKYLQRRGFGFALSGAGVGAGANSFQAVSDFAPDYINLDRRLIQNFDRPVCAPRISKLVQMAEQSGARVVAEGVDRIRIVENLWLLGVRFMQGHLFGEPARHIA